MRQFSPKTSAIGTSLLLVFSAAQLVVADVQCPPPDSPDAYVISEAPSEIFSVTRLPDDVADEYIFHIDVNYGALSLNFVQVVYGSDNELMLATTIDTSPLADTQVLASVVVNEAISDNVRLVWSYFESGALCPEFKHFEYTFVGK